jgi:hypothetical protein
MNRTQHRILTILATTSAAVALGSAPALAGSDGCSGGDCQDEDTPAKVVPVAPTPVAPAPLPLSAGDVSPEHSSNAPRTHDVSPTRHVVHGTRTVAQRTVVTRTVPRGAVAAGAGGMAPEGPDGLFVGLGGAALLLLATGGGLVASGRHARR